MSILIDTKDITKVYKMGEIEVQALRGITIQIGKGEYIAITGPSGSGKSTLMHIIGCLDTTTSGTYSFAGKSVHELSEDMLAEMRNKEIGFVFQFFNLLPRLKAYENVELPLLYGGKRANEAKTQALMALERVGLKGRANHRPTELSGGECQRVAIARAIVTNPSLILADEPTGNLDTQTSEEIMTFFDTLHKEGRTIIVVTHSQEVAEHTERNIKIRDGMVVDS
ncbi:MAG: ABC transporter ATP-binding protein [Candidatus Stahlbacteria bacterium]|nr:ABC transporter ATP-binding protein [Candidatus Stahlbacteria bacterium]